MWSLSSTFEAARPPDGGPDVDRGGRVVMVMVSRAQLLELVERSGLSEDEKERILGVDQPVDVANLEAVLDQLGYSRDEMVSYMGGSP